LRFDENCGFMHNTVGDQFAVNVIHESESWLAGWC
jgi:hypothetical protein